MVVAHMEDFRPRAGFLPQNGLYQALKRRRRAVRRQIAHQGRSIADESE